MAAIVFQDLSLLRARAFEAFIDEPRAFVVLDVSADLTSNLWDIEAKIVILNLIVLSCQWEDLLRLLKVLGRGEVQFVQRKGGWREEAVVRGLEVDDEAVLFDAELVAVRLVLWCGQ